MALLYGVLVGSDRFEILMPIDSNKTLFPAPILRGAILNLTPLIGLGMANALLAELKGLELDLYNESYSYYLRELQDGIELTFGKDAAKLIIERIKRELEK